MTDRPKVLEADIKAQICDYLQYRGAHVIKLLGHLGREGGRIFRQKPGLLDLVICYRGYFIGAEIKTPKGRVTQVQQQEIEAIIRAGGRAIVARCVEDVKAVLDAIDRDIVRWAISHDDKFEEASE